MTTAAVIVIGNEVLTGKVDEANARHLIHELRDAGVDLVRVVVVRDELDVIAEEVARASARCDHVFTSGGVGGTHDDVTMPAVAAAFGVGLVEQPVLAGLLRGRYGDRANVHVMRMAQVPEGAELVGEDELRYPVVRVRNVYVLPGVPEFLRAKFAYLKPRLGGQPVRCETLYVSVGEEEIAAELEAAQGRFPGVEIGSYPRFDTPDYRVKITLEGRAPEQLEAAVQGLTAALAGVLVPRPPGG